VLVGAMGPSGLRAVVEYGDGSPAGDLAVLASFLDGYSALAGRVVG
jgi:hypothetical protein